MRMVAYRLGKDLGIFDVDTILDAPAWQLVEWMAFYKIEADDMEQRTLQAKAAAKVQNRQRIG